MENYVDADVFLKQIESETVSEDVLHQFQRQFEKLVVLDYIIRNTGKKTRLTIYFLSLVRILCKHNHCLN